MLNIFSKRPKYQIEFFSREWIARKYYPVRLAKDCFPEYWKKIPTFTGPKDEIGTAKRCPGISDWMATGFIISAWTDIVVEQDPEKGLQKVSLHNNRTGASAHPPYQCLNLLEGKSHHLGSVKLPGTWMIKTSPGWSIMLVPLWYWQNQPWEQMPGIMHSDNHHCEINMNMILKTKESFTIEAGTPLCQVIPFKRDPVLALTRATRDTDIARHNILLRAYEWWKSGYVKFYRQKPNYKIEQTDTELEESLTFPIQDYR